MEMMETIMEISEEEKSFKTVHAEHPVTILLTVTMTKTKSMTSITMTDSMTKHLIYGPCRASAYYC